ncbi:hypothetical protein PINS_up005611 [Pythium insidiosum]|nr:hypothetical protein PINS_up005611 [Pythium insidiosum]
MRRRLTEQLPATAAIGTAERPSSRDEERLLPDVSAPPASVDAPSRRRIKGGSNSSSQPTRPVPPAFNALSGGETRRVLDLRDKQKLRPIWLAPDEGDQQVVRPPTLDGSHYGHISMSRFGQDVLVKMKRADALAVQLEKSARFMDAVHTYEQSSKMLVSLNSHLHY